MNVRKFSKQLAFIERCILNYIHFGTACLLNVILSFAKGLHLFNKNQITSKEEGGILPRRSLSREGGHFVGGDFTVDTESLLSHSNSSFMQPFMHQNC